VSLLDYNKEGVAYAFLDRVFSRFGALIEVLSKHGTKLHGGVLEIVGKNID
jgi:hypothetical protein